MGSPTWWDPEFARLARNVTIVRHSKGSPTIHHDAAATADVHRALKEHGWKALDKIANDLRQLGYEVELRLFKLRAGDELPGAGGYSN